MDGQTNSAYNEAAAAVPFSSYRRIVWTTYHRLHGSSSHSIGPTLAKTKWIVGSDSHDCSSVGHSTNPRFKIGPSLNVVVVNNVSRGPFRSNAFPLPNKL
jgi:hypothetical protein